MAVPKVMIQIVTYNSEKEIVNSLEHIDGLVGNFKKKVFVIDNASTDQTVDVVKGLFPKVKVRENKVNLGFAGGHNTNLRDIKDLDYVLILNPDVQLKKDYLQILLNELERNPSVGMASGLLVRSGLQIIDSAGIGMKKSRRPFDQLQEKSMDTIKLAQGFNLGPCGAAAIYRRSFIEDLMIEHQFFDEEFFIYKEDVDICWRGQLLGWSSLFIPTAIAIHERGWKQNSRANISRFVKYHSFKNRYLLMFKNDDWINILLHLPWILSTEILFLIYITFREPYLFKAWARVIQLIPRMFKKRKLIMTKRKASPKEMRKWFV